MKVPAITTNPPPSSSDTIRPKKSGVFAMASTTDRPTVKGAPQNPTTPVLPRMRAATSQRTTPNLNTSSGLHPTIASRSPKSLARKTRAESVASPDPAYNHHSLTPRGYAPARPSSAASNRSFVTVGSSHARPSQSMFFHASEVGGSTSTHAPPPQPVYTAPAPYVAATVASSGPKFFHADGASLEDDSEPYRAPRAPRGLGASPQLMINGPIHTAMPSARNANHSPPSSRPGSTAGYPASPHPASVIGGSRTPALASSGMPEGRSRVKFVYANGAEELLSPRRSSSEAGSVTTSPQLPSSPRFGDSHVATASPAKVAYPLSPLASPSGLHSPPQYFQRHVAYSSSRRSSLETKVRHSRNASISSVIDMSVPTKEENGDADDEGQSGTGESGSSGDEHDEGDELDEEHPPPPAPAPPMTAAERIKAMEERAANSRRERKVMDLEISNASLLAINKTLEREMRKQTAELRRYKRLARSGKLAAPSKAKSQSGGSASASEGENAGVADGEHWEVDDEEDEDTETEELSEEEEEEEEDSKSEGTANGDKHQEGDEKRLALDLSKHQALLESSAKMNKSLSGCLLVTDQLIKEGKKALEYKVRASDVRLGGRILRDEEDDYLDLESVDGDGLTSDFSNTGDTEAENTEAEETETEDEEGFQVPCPRPEELQPVRHTLV